MAYNDFITNINNADIDAQALSKFMQGANGEVVKRRIANDIKTLQYYIDYLRGLELVYSQQTGEVDVNGVKVKTVTQAIKDAINTAGVANGVNANLVVFGNRTQSSKNLDTVNVLDYMTANELSAYQANAATFNAAPVFNRASVDCYNKKRKLMAYGTFYTTETIVITSDCDLSQADIFTTANLGIDVRSVVKADADSKYRLINMAISLPRVLECKLKTGLGWIAGTVGVKFTNLYSCHVVVGQVSKFETNMLVYAIDVGNVYNEYHIGHLYNGKINLLLDCNDAGWTNENNFYGGRYSHESGEGTNVSGVRHIKIANVLNIINNNVFHKPSIEGNTPEYHVENGGSYNTFAYARWEAQPPKLLYYSDDNISIAANLANKNLVIGGYDVDGIVVTNIGTKTKFNNRLIGHSRQLSSISSSTGGYRYRNSSSNGYAVFSIFDAAADITTVDASQYLWSFSANNILAKKPTDASPKINMDAQNGRIFLGNGTTAPTAGLSSFGTSAAWYGADFCCFQQSTYNLGQANYRWKQLYLSDGIGAWGATPPTSKPSVTGSRGGNAALASLIAAGAAYGLWTDNTTA